MAVRVLDELVRPLNELSLDANEFACLKAIVFFDPGTVGYIFNFENCALMVWVDLTVKQRGNVQHNEATVLRLCSH